MRAIANDVPPEIWDLVASFLPRAEQSRLMPVNRYFLSKVMHERYGEVRWTMLDSSMLRYLRRLQDPFVAEYVQKLHVQAWFITQLDRRKALQKLDKPLGRSITKGLQAFLNHFDSQARISAAVKGNNPTKYTADQILALMGRALSQMNNLTYYSFEWRDLPLTGNSRAFLQTIQQSASCLRKLVLHAQITNFKYLLNYVYFENLEDVSFHFNYDTVSDRNGSLGDPPEANSVILKNEVATFINRLAPSLHRLSFSVHSTTPMTPLLKALVFLPHLRDVEFNMPFGPASTPPTVLLEFLTTYSSSLRHLKIDPPFQRTAHYQGAPQTHTEVESRAHSWSRICDLLLESPSVLSNLKGLDIPSTGSLETTLNIVRPSVDTLTRLSLSGQYFNPAEQLTIYGIFSSRPLYDRLLHLRIDVITFNLKVLYDIAYHFPKLESLILVTENEPNCVSTRRLPRISGVQFVLGELSQGSSESGFMFRDPFTYTLSTLSQAKQLTPHVVQTLHEWGLQDLGICVERYQEHQKHCSRYAWSEYQAMVKVRQYVRSIKYFRGEEQREGADFWT